MTSSVPDTKLPSSGATTAVAPAYTHPAPAQTIAQATNSSSFSRAVGMPRYWQRTSFSRMATSRRPKSLRTIVTARVATTTSSSPATRNQLSVSRSGTSKPDSPLLDPVVFPPAKMSCTNTIGNTRVIVET